MKATSDVQHRDSTFQGAGDVELYEQSWRLAGKCRAVVVLVHGAAEHSGRYGHVAKRLARHGYAGQAFDLRGHGRSGGNPGYVHSFTLYLEDLERFVVRIRKGMSDEPFFLLGHSMGGAIAALYVIKHRPDIEGLLLSAPTVVLGEGVSAFTVRLAKLLGRFLPRMPVINIDSNKISRDKNVVQRYEKDPPVYHEAFPARSGAQLFGAMKNIEERMEDVELPLLIMHGTEDQLVDVAGSWQLYNRASSTDKTLQLYDGLYHEVLNEPEKERVLADMTGWLNGRL